MEMNWEKSSEELVALFASLMPRAAGVEQRKMFGWPCFFVHGNLFAGLHKQGMIFRLSEQEQSALLKLDGAAEFEPMPGRKMRGYVFLSNALARDRRELAKWVGRSLECGARLPAKSKAKQKASPSKKKSSRAS
jgi:TfoX/Sxy family transcriptional regulator of competence genes